MIRRFLKHRLQDVATLLVAPIYAAFFVESVFAGRGRAFRGASQLVGLVPGPVGDFMRNAFYRLTLDSCDREVFFGFGTIFLSPRCRIGKHVVIGPYGVIGACTVGSDVLIGSHVSIPNGGAHQHGIFDVRVPMRLQPGEFEPIAIGEDCWIGDRAILMADVGPKSVVGAGSVVVRKVEESSVVAGNPAHLIRKRS